MRGHGVFTDGAPDSVSVVKMRSHEKVYSGEEEEFVLPLALRGHYCWRVEVHCTKYFYTARSWYLTESSDPTYKNISSPQTELQLHYYKHSHIHYYNSASPPPMVMCRLT